MVIDEEVKQSMQIESIVEYVEVDEVKVNVDPIGEGVDMNNEDRMTSGLTSLVTQPDNMTSLLRCLRRLILLVMS